MTKIKQESLNSPVFWVAKNIRGLENLPHLGSTAYKGNLDWRKNKVESIWGKDHFGYTTVHDVGTACSCSAHYHNNRWIYLSSLPKTPNLATEVDESSLTSKSSGDRKVEYRTVPGVKDGRALERAQRTAEENAIFAEAWHNLISKTQAVEDIPELAEDWEDEDPNSPLPNSGPGFEGEFEERERAFWKSSEPSVENHAASKVVHVCCQGDLQHTDHERGGDSVEPIAKFKEKVSKPSRNKINEAAGSKDGSSEKAATPGKNAFNKESAVDSSVQGRTKERICPVLKSPPGETYRDELSSIPKIDVKDNTNKAILLDPQGQHWYLLDIDDYKFNPKNERIEIRVLNKGHAPA